MRSAKQTTSNAGLENSRFGEWSLRGYIRGYIHPCGNETQIGCMANESYPPTVFWWRMIINILKCSMCWSKFDFFEWNRKVCEIAKCKFYANVIIYFKLKEKFVLILYVQSPSISIIYKIYIGWKIIYIFILRNYFT